MAEDDQVEPQDEARQNSPIVQATGGDGTVDTAAGNEACYWNDKKYSDGATVCEAGTRHKCWNGKWVEIGLC